MPRGLIKTGIASALHWTGADNLFAAGRKNLPLIIGYHRVVEDFRINAARSIAPSLIAARTLERHLDWIGRRFAFITLDELAAWLQGTRQFDRPVAAITFDDGYSDVYHHAFPILKRKGIPAAVFVVTDLISTPHLQIHDQLYLLLASAISAWRPPRRRLVQLLLGLEMPPPLLKKVSMAAGDPFRVMRVLFTTLSQAEIHRVIETLRAEVEVSENAMKELRSLSWEMLGEMSRMGVTVGSHTRTHALLTNETWQKVLDETEGSRQAVEQRLGMTVAHFAYPDGCFNAAAVRAVAAAGYRCAYTTCGHRDVDHPALTMPRRVLWENSCLDAFGRFSSASMSCQVNGVFDFVTQCGKDHG